MYSVVTRPDVAACVSMASRYLNEPKQAHVIFATRVLQYLYATREMKLVYTKTQNPELKVFADSSWSDDPDTRRSRYGYLIFYGDALISWKSKLHSCVALSTAEAEYVAATESCKELLWLKYLFEELEHEFSSPISLYEDNEACIKMSKNHMVSARNKHLETKMHYIREKVEDGTIMLQHIGTKNQLADLLTKTLPHTTYTHLRDQIMDPGLHRPEGMR